jgi:release factor glutamine methyltransferase
MFVSDNSLASLNEYFTNRLSYIYSEREISYFLKESILFRLQISSAEFLLEKNMKFSESDLLFFRNVVKRLKSREPFQYILGETEFYNLKLKCDTRALIPRPETEELVDWVVQSLELKNNYTIVDMCTGSGCIALALKSKLSISQILATDLSQDALALAKKNAMYLGLNVDLLEDNALLNDSDIFENNSIDVIVSNPPYIPLKDKSQMEKNVLDFEPHMALFVSDETPLIFYRAIAEKAKILLKSNGLLFFELHEEYANSTKELVENLGFKNVEVKQDLQGKDRMLKAKKI